MAISTFTVWDVHHHDGCGGSNHVCYMTDENDAKALADDGHGSARLKTITIMGNHADYVQYAQGAKKRAALAKLTKEERILLGLE